MISHLFDLINVADLLVACIFCRCIYIGAKAGILFEIFKIIGMVFANIITAHYFVRFAYFLAGMIPLPFPYLQTLSFVILWLLVVLVFHFVGEGWLLAFNLRDREPVWPIAGGVLGAARAVLVSGLFFILIFVSGDSSLSARARSSFFGFYLQDVTPQIYAWAYDEGIARMFPAEPRNDKVFELVGLPKD